MLLQCAPVIQQSKVDETTANNNYHYSENK